MTLPLWSQLRDILTEASCRGFFVLLLFSFVLFFNSGSALLILGFVCYNIEKNKGYFLNAKKIIMFFGLFFFCQRD